MFKLSTDVSFCWERNDIAAVNGNPHHQASVESIQTRGVETQSSRAAIQTGFLSSQAENQLSAKASGSPGERAVHLVGQKSPVGLDSTPLI